MKKYNIYIAIALFVIGLLIGILSCRSYNRHEAKNLIQRDTVILYDTIHYTKTEIKTIEVPKKEKPEVVYIQVTDTIYRDSIVYVVLPKKHYYTTTKDVEIWHSGVESSIDSLNVFRQTLAITERKIAKNAISLGIEAGYIGTAYVPAYIQYERKPKQWLSIYGKVQYDIVSHQWGVMAGTKVQIQF